MKLSWKKRTWEAGAVIQTSCTPCDIIERHARKTGTNDGHASDGFGRLIRGDALEVLGALTTEGVAGTVQLAYVDPPYLSQTDYQHEARLDGPADGRVKRSTAYGDRWKGDDEGVGEYLDMLAPRLDALSRMLTPTGTLWIQLDWRAAYLARVILDEIFGRAGFKNEIVWRRAPNLGRQAASGQFGRTLDTLLVYGGPAAKLVPPTRLEPIEESAVRVDDEGRRFTTAPRGDYTDESIAKLDAEGRIHRTASGKVYVKYFLTKDAAGTWCRERRVDSLWTDVPPLRHAATSERTGYPTQKPLALLERIIACGSKPGDVVLDVFGGSGTTAEAAFRLNRRFLISDKGALAISTARARLLRAGAALSVETCGVPEPHGDKPVVEVERRSGERVDVRLVEPREPLAWAIDASPHARAPFSCTWHSERKPGARPVPATTTATLDRASDRIAVRVYEDDGTVRSTSLSLSRSRS